jgi:hypothetical protein
MLIGVYTGNLTEMYPTQSEGESNQAYNKRVQFGKGMRDAFAECFQVTVASVRISHYGAYMQSIPCPPSYEIMVDLIPAIEAGWKAAMDTSSGRNGVRDIAAFYEALEPFLADYIFPDKLEEQMERQRREMVLVGEEEPIEGDAEWIEEKAVQMEQRAADIRARLQVSS